MPMDLTLTDVPDKIYERLKASAVMNHRSLDSEIIARLRAKVMTRRISAEEHLASIRAVRGRLTQAKFDHADVDRFKREGRA